MTSVRLHKNKRPNKHRTRNIQIAQIVPEQLARLRLNKHIFFVNCLQLVFKQVKNIFIDGNSKKGSMNL